MFVAHDLGGIVVKDVRGPLSYHARLTGRVSLMVGLPGLGSSDFGSPKLAGTSGFESGSGICHAHYCS